MPKPVYDPVTGLPYYAPGDASDRPIKSKCCCPTANTYSFSFDLTGCASGSCDPGAASGTLVYQATTESQDICTWTQDIGPDWNITLGIFFGGTADLSIARRIGGLQCWLGDLGADGDGNAIKFDCEGSNVFNRTGGNCTGPTTITVTKV